MKIDPILRQARLARAVELDRGGQAQAALAEFEALAAQAHDSAELLVHLGRALLASNRADEAERVVCAGLATWPADAALHVLLAELRWQRGVGEDATATLEAAIDEHPREMHLRLVAAELLRNMGRSERALALLLAGLERAPDSAAFLTSIGVVLDDLDRTQEALGYLRAAIPRARQPATAQRNLVPALLRSGAAAEALRLVDALLVETPDDQKTLAYRSTALRMLGDVRYPTLCDYGRLVRVYRLQPPARHADIASFNEAFARELAALHLTSRRPIAQSLRGGTQTEKHLPAGNPVIADFFAMLDAPIRDYVSRLDAGSSHPADRRRRASYRIAGSWSVRLEPGGFHTDHVHPQGWLSSAYYVGLPTTSRSGSRAGWLKFGEPGVRVGLAPDHFVEPEAGLLALFPSFFWHGTVPFNEGGVRLTAAFDVLPV